MHQRRRRPQTHIVASRGGEGRSLSSVQFRRGDRRRSRRSDPSILTLLLLESSFVGRPALYSRRDVIVVADADDDVDDLGAVSLLFLATDPAPVGNMT